MGWGEPLQGFLSPLLGTLRNLGPDCGGHWDFSPTLRAASLLCQGMLAHWESCCDRECCHVGGPAVTEGVWMSGVQLCQEGFGVLGVPLCQGVLACQGSRCVGGPAVLGGGWHVGVSLCWDTLKCQGSCCARVLVCWGSCSAGGSWGLPMPCRTGGACGKGDNTAGSAPAPSQVGGHCKNIPTLEYGFLVQVRVLHPAHPQPAV